MKQQKKEDSKKDAAPAVTAKQIMDQLQTLTSRNKTDNLRYYQGGNKATKSFGSTMAAVFKLAKEHMQLCHLQKLKSYWTMIIMKRESLL